MCQTGADSAFKKTAIQASQLPEAHVLDRGEKEMIILEKKKCPRLRSRCRAALQRPVSWTFLAEAVHRMRLVCRVHPTGAWSVGSP